MRCCGRSLLEDVRSRLLGNFLQSERPLLGGGGVGGGGVTLRLLGEWLLYVHCSLLNWLSHCLLHIHRLLLLLWDLLYNDWLGHWLLRDHDCRLLYHCLVWLLLEKDGLGWSDDGCLLGGLLCDH